MSVWKDYLSKRPDRAMPEPSQFYEMKTWIVEKEHKRAQEDRKEVKKIIKLGKSDYTSATVTAEKIKLASDQRKNVADQGTVMGESASAVFECTFLRRIHKLIKLARSRKSSNGPSMINVLKRMILGQPPERMRQR